MSIVVFDIETIRKPIPQAYKDAVKAGRLKVDNVTKEPKKIWDKLKEKWWASPEGAQPIAVAFAKVDMAKFKVEEPVGYATDDEAKMAAFVLQAFAGMAPSKLVGFNSDRFDFPILETLMRHAQGRAPRGIGRWDNIDLAKQVPMFFNVYRPLKGSPHSVASLYGLSHGETTGDDVAILWEQDKAHGTHKVLDYCMDDVDLTGRVFLHLSKLRSLT